MKLSDSISIVLKNFICSVYIRVLRADDMTSVYTRSNWCGINAASSFISASALWPNINSLPLSNSFNFLRPSGKCM